MKNKKNGLFRNLGITQLYWNVQYLILKKFYNSDQFSIKWIEQRKKYYEKFGPFPCSANEIIRLENLKNKFLDNRIFILGNGPSLNNVPLTKLKNEWTFGVNRIYLLFPKTSWRPSFYTVTDWRVVADVSNEINKLSNMTFFFPERFNGLLHADGNVYWFWKKLGMTPDCNLPVENRFAFDIHSGVFSGGSVLVTAIQLAYHMGFNPIYLVGVDHKYTVMKTVIQSGIPKINGVRINLLSTQDDDLNHFDLAYFGKNRMWRAPNIVDMTKGFQNCRDALESKGKRIYNATDGGELNVLERVHFDDLFD